MSSSKKFLVILRDDRKLLGMLGGIAADVVIPVGSELPKGMWGTKV
jgi:hypothetical protein